MWQKWKINRLDLRWAVIVFLLHCCAHFNDSGSRWHIFFVWRLRGSTSLLLWGRAVHDRPTLELWETTATHKLPECACRVAGYELIESWAQKKRREREKREKCGDTVKQKGTSPPGSCCESTSGASARQSNTRRRSSRPIGRLVCWAPTSVACMARITLDSRNGGSIH